MKLYTMGFTQKNAEKFFGLIINNKIEMLVDIRLNNKSQLAGFTKGDDLKYFLNKICNCNYAHKEIYAPTKEILDAYKKGNIAWEGYVEKYIPLMEKRKSTSDFIKNFGKYESVCLLCSEPTPEQCHRRLFAEMVKTEVPEIEIIHL